MTGANGTAAAVTGGAALAALPAVTEAPASVTVKLAYRGHDVMLTLRGLDGRSVLGRLDVALTWLEQHGATPAPVGARAAAAAPTCPTHGGAMKAGKRGGWFCPVKIADDDGAGRPIYCRQRVSGGAS